MNFTKKFDFETILGTHSLIYGETDTKKTFFTAKFVEFLLETKNIPPKEVTILDFAPKLAYVKNLKIGGRIQDYYDNSMECNYINFEGEIIPPRLNAHNKKEMYYNICLNFNKIYKILEIYNKNPTSVLIVNDISLYLHLGNIQYLINTINKSNTFFGNAYYGKSIGTKFSKLLTLKEKKRVEFLIKNIENSFKTS